jgi:NADH-quinone oxidoreductase subunit K
MLTIGLNDYLIVSALLFCIGLFGVLIRRNIILMVAGIEMMLSAVNLTLVSFGQYWNNPAGQIAFLFVMTIAAAEVAVGLSLIVLLYKQTEKVEINFYNHLKG